MACDFVLFSLVEIAIPGSSAALRPCASADSGSVGNTLRGNAVLLVFGGEAHYWVSPLERLLTIGSVLL